MPIARMWFSRFPTSSCSTIGGCMECHSTGGILGVRMRVCINKEPMCPAVFGYDISLVDVDMWIGAAVQEIPQHFGRFQSHIDRDQQPTCRSGFRIGRFREKAQCVFL
ncbi:MAG: hypothetical protein C5B51_03905 [Terriglobia bacterium]|nr:MAG: hypothetical protein C5B51_03905 [Terriglobia bacterium]